MSDWAGHAFSGNLDDEYDDIVGAENVRPQFSPIHSPSEGFVAGTSQVLRESSETAFGEWRLRCCQLRRELNRILKGCALEENTQLISSFIGKNKAHIDDEVVHLILKAMSEGNNMENLQSTTGEKRPRVASSSKKLLPILVDRMTKMQHVPSTLAIVHYFSFMKRLCFDDVSLAAMMLPGIAARLSYQQRARIKSVPVAGWTVNIPVGTVPLNPCGFHLSVSELTDCFASLIPLPVSNSLQDVLYQLDKKVSETSVPITVPVIIGSSDDMQTVQYQTADLIFMSLSQFCKVVPVFAKFKRNTPCITNLLWSLIRKTGLAKRSLATDEDLKVISKSIYRLLQNSRVDSIQSSEPLLVLCEFMADSLLHPDSELVGSEGLLANLIQCLMSQPLDDFRIRKLMRAVTVYADRFDLKTIQDERFQIVVFQFIVRTVGHYLPCYAEVDDFLCLLSSMVNYFWNHHIGNKIFGDLEHSSADNGQASIAKSFADLITLPAKKNGYEPCQLRYCLRHLSRDSCAARLFFLSLRPWLGFTPENIETLNSVVPPDVSLTDRLRGFVGMQMLRGSHKKGSLKDAVDTINAARELATRWNLSDKLLREMTVDFMSICESYCCLDIDWNIICLGSSECTEFQADERCALCVSLAQTVGCMDNNDQLFPVVEEHIWSLVSKEISTRMQSQAPGDVSGCLGACRWFADISAALCQSRTTTCPQYGLTLSAMTSLLLKGFDCASIKTLDHSVILDFLKSLAIVCRGCPSMMVLSSDAAIRFTQLVEVIGKLIQATTAFSSDQLDQNALALTVLDLCSGLTCVASACRSSVDVMNTLQLVGIRSFEIIYGLDVSIGLWSSSDSSIRYEFPCTSLINALLLSMRTQETDTTKLLANQLRLVESILSFDGLLSTLSKSFSLFKSQLFLDSLHSITTVLTANKLFVLVSDWSNNRIIAQVTLLLKRVCQLFYTFEEVAYKHDAMSKAVLDLISHPINDRNDYQRRKLNMVSLQSHCQYSIEEGIRRTDHALVSLSGLLELITKLIESSVVRHGLLFTHLIDYLQDVFHCCCFQLHLSLMRLHNITGKELITLWRASMQLSVLLATAESLSVELRYPPSLGMLLPFLSEDLFVIGYRTLQSHALMINSSCSTEFDTLCSLELFQLFMQFVEYFGGFNRFALPNDRMWQDDYQEELSLLTECRIFQEILQITPYRRNFHTHWGNVEVKWIENTKNLLYFENHSAWKSLVVGSVARSFQSLIRIQLSSETSRRRTALTSSSLTHGDIIVFQSPTEALCTSTLDVLIDLVPATGFSPQVMLNRYLQRRLMNESLGFLYVLVVLDVDILSNNLEEDIYRSCEEVLKALCLID